MDHYDDRRARLNSLQKARNEYAAESPALGWKLHAAICALSFILGIFARTAIERLLGLRGSFDGFFTFLSLAVWIGGWIFIASKLTRTRYANYLRQLEIYDMEIESIKGMLDQLKS